MIRKKILVTGLAMSMCLNQMPPTVLVRASQTNNDADSKFEVNINKGKASKYGYIRPAGQSYATNPKSKLKKANNLSSSYGDMDKVVRNQNPFGTCWAFAGTGNFEYAVDKKENNNVDYSEEHMIQRLSKNGDTGYQITDKNTGGNEYMYSGYFASGYGPVDDSLFPYNTGDSLLQLVPAMLSAKGDYRATDIQFFQTVSNDDTGALSDETTATVKEAVYENGSATCGITWNEDMIQSDNVSYYNSNENARDNLNHEVLIVGWDDDYSADHFDGVTKNGAWLIRNSWGDGKGEHGYFWVSYQDKSLVPSCSIKSYERVSNDDTVYNLDESGALYPQVTYNGSSKVGFINSFSLKKREKLKEVTFYESETGAKYQLFYIPVKDDGTLDMSQKQAITEKKTLSYPGYHTEKITQSITVKKAAIMVMVESNKESAGLGAEGSISDGSKQLYIPTLEKGQSYIYANDQLNDLSDMGTNFGNWSIKLVTTKAEASFYSKNHKNATDLGTYKWTGNSVTPEIGDILSEDDDQVLKEGVDYEVEYSNNIDPGTATMKAVGLGEYSNCSLTFTYTISHRTFHVNGHKDGDHLGEKDWTGKNIEYDLGNIFSDSEDKVLREGTDYKIQYRNNQNIGTATVEVIGLGDYEGCNLKFTYDIVESCGYNGFYAADHKDGDSLGSVKWTGNEVEVKPGVIRCSHCKKELKEGTDYKLEYKNNVNPGTATVKVIGLDKYEGREMTFSYTIQNRTFHISDHEDGDSLGSVKWTGKEVKYNIEAILSDHNEEILEENKDYEIKYSNNIDPGTATMKITGIGDYKGCNLTFTYTIESDCGYGGFYAESYQNGADLGTYDWTGNEVQPYTGKILCKHCNRELDAGIDYIVQYSDNVDPGTATMKVIGIGKYEGREMTFSYTIQNRTFHISGYKDGDSLGSVKWTGKEVKYNIAAVFSDHNSQTLEENKDYEIEYSNNVDPGTAIMKITGIGDYRGCNLTFTYTIEADCGYGGFYVQSYQNGADLGTYDWTGNEVQPYTGKILCKHCNRELDAGIDYIVQYSDNVDPGTATMKITGIGKYAGYEYQFTYTIGRKAFQVNDHKNGDVLGEVKWTGHEIKYDIGYVLDRSGKQLEEGKDYKITYSNNTNPGIANVKVTGLGEYEGNNYEFTFKIIEDCGYSGFYDSKYDENENMGSYKWTGTEIEIKPEHLHCTHCNRELVEGTDYTVQYTDNINPGIATVKIVGLGQFEGHDMTYHYTIKNKTFHNSGHENGENLGTVEWTGKETKYDVKGIVSDYQDVVLTEGVDYKLVYKNNVNVGTAEVEVIGINDYKGCNMIFTYKIHKTETPNNEKPVVKKQQITYTSTPSNVTYTGKAITKKITVKSGNVVLKEGKDYKIAYSNNKNCGIATMKITGIGNYQGTITKTFKILPKQGVIQKLKAGKKNLTVTMKKNSEGITGYQIRYSYKKNLSSSKYKISKRTSYKITGLKSKKYIYVRIRAYKQVGKTKIYGSWSASKKVKIK